MPSFYFHVNRRHLTMEDPHEKSLINYNILEIPSYDKKRKLFRTCTLTSEKNYNEQVFNTMVSHD